MPNIASSVMVHSKQGANLVNRKKSGTSISVIFHLLNLFDPVK